MAGNDPRILYTKFALKVQTKGEGEFFTYQEVATLLSPGFYAIHNVQAEEPEEDVLLMGNVDSLNLRLEFNHSDDDFPLSSTFIYQMVAGARRYRGLSMAQAVPTILAVTKSHGPGRKVRSSVSSSRWLLKTPDHMYFFRALNEVFPDGTLLIPHRDPAVSVASFSSMCSHAMFRRQEMGLN